MYSDDSFGLNVVCYRLPIIILLVTLMLTASIPLAIGSIEDSRDEASIPSGARRGDWSFHNVTLITGDRVLVWMDEEGRIVSLAVEPADPRRLGQHFLIFTLGNDTYVIPSWVDLTKFDRELFNINRLIRDECDKLPHIPVIIQYSEEFRRRMGAQTVTEDQQEEIHHILEEVERRGKVRHVFSIASLLSADIEKAKLRGFSELLMESPIVQRVWLNRRIYVKLSDSVPLIGAPYAWSLCYNGSGIKIAILDTGINKTHPSLDDFDDNPATYDPKVIVEESFVEEPDPEPMDYNGHGTHCAGIAAATQSIFIWPSDGGSRVLVDEEYETPIYSKLWIELDDWENNDIIYYEYNFTLIMSNGTSYVKSGRSIETMGDIYDEVSYDEDGDGAPDLFRRIYIYAYSSDDDTLYGYVKAWNGTEWVPISKMVVGPGVAPGAYLWNVKVLNRWGWGYWDWVIAGIEFAAYGPDGEPNTGDEADILSMSLGSDWWSDGSDPVSMAVDAAVDAGRIVVVAAGNWGEYSTIGVPATAKKAITVGATTKSDELAFFSSCGPTVDMRVKPDVLAPGVGITSSAPWGAASWSGTSMATPHVAGAAAILKQASGFEPPLIKSWLISTADLLPGYNVYQQGGGRINLTSALNTAVLPHPATISFGVYDDNTTDSATITLYNLDETSGRRLNFTVQVQDIASGEFLNCAWLNATTLTLPPSSQGKVSLWINTSIPKSIYSGVVLIETNASETLHVIFGFSKLNKVNIHKIDIYGRDADDDPIWIVKYDPKSYMDFSLFTNWGWLDDYGNATFYLNDGYYYIISEGWENDTTYWTISEGVIRNSTYIELDERETVPITIDLNRTDMVVCQKDSSINIDVGYWLPFPCELWDIWWYPNNLETYVSPTTLNVTFGCSFYPAEDYNPSDPGQIESSEWYKLHYAELGVSGPIEYVVNYTELVEKKTDYRVAQTPEVLAAYAHWAFTSKFYQPCAATYVFTFTAPKSRVELLSPHTTYDMDVWKEEDLGEASTPYWRWWGSIYSGENTGEALYDAWNSHPIHMFYTNWWWSWIEDNSTRYSLTIYSEPEDAYLHREYCWWDDWNLNRILVYRNGTLIWNDTCPWYDYMVDLYDQPTPSEYHVIIDCYTYQYLSPYIHAEAGFLFKPERWSDVTPPRVRPYIKPEPDLNNTIIGGPMRLMLDVEDDSNVSSLSAWYSIDGGETWTPITLTAYPNGTYIGEIDALSGGYLSIGYNASDTLGNWIAQYIIDGVKLPEAHDLSVSLEAPRSLAPGSSVILNATVQNVGIYNESDVELYLLLDGAVVNQTVISLLPSGSEYTITYRWTPVEEGWYNITAYAPSVPGENRTGNNIDTRMVYVGGRIALISHYSELMDITGILDEMGIPYDVYNDNHIHRYTEDLDLLQEYRAVIYYNRGGLLSDDEYEALEAYISNGGNLLITGFDSLIDDPRMAELIRSSSYGDNMGEPDLIVVEASHPIMNGPYGSFPEGYHITDLYDDCDMAEADTGRGAVTVAELADGYDKIIATIVGPGRVVYWNGDGRYDWLWNEDCEAMLKNTIAWLMKPIGRLRDIAVDLETPIYLLPGESSILNLTVQNRGTENETDVIVNLYINGSLTLNETIPLLRSGESITVSYDWTPTEGWYNITAYLHPLPGENYTGNNIDTEWIDVSTTPRHIGDIILGDNETIIIEDVNLTQIGNIILRDNATLIIRNATIHIKQEYWNQYHITLSGSSHLWAENASIISNDYFYIWMKDSSEGSLDPTYISSSMIWLEDDATLRVYNSTLWGIACSDSSRLEVFDSHVRYIDVQHDATVEVWESEIDWEVYVSDHSDVTLLNSDVGISSIGFEDANATITGLTTGIYGFWNIHLNESVTGVNWNFTLINTEISEGWNIICWEDSKVSIRNSTIRFLDCYENSRVSVFDSEIEWNVYIGAWDRSQVTLVNTIVRMPNIGFSGSYSSDSGSYERGYEKTFSTYLMDRYEFNHTSELGHQQLPREMETYGDWTPAEVVLTDLNPGFYRFWNIHLNESVSGVDWNLTLIDTTITEGWKIKTYDDSKVIIYNSTLEQLWCYDYSNVAIHNSMIEYLYCDEFHGDLSFYNTGILYRWNIWYSDFYIEGTIDFSDIDLRIYDSTVTRNYPAIVLMDGDIAEDVNLTLTDEEGNTLWSGVTDAEGWAYFNITYMDENYTESCHLIPVDYPDYAVEVGITSDTPIELEITTAMHSINIDLHEGWNLIGMSLRPEDASIEAIFDENLPLVKAIYGYENGSWSYWIRGLPAKYQTLNALEFGRGYWVLVEGNFTITLRGYLDDMPPLIEGWNIVAINGTKPITVGELAENYPDIRYIYGYDDENKTWSYWIRGLEEYATLSELEPGRGYWIYLSP